MGDYVIDDPVEVLPPKKVPDSGQVYLGDYKGKTVRLVVEAVEDGETSVEDAELDVSEADDGGR